MRALFIAVLLLGCAKSHEPIQQCVELGPRRCLIDRSCWCSADDAGGEHCTTCRATCGPECSCRSVGGLPASTCQ